VTTAPVLRFQGVSKHYPQPGARVHKALDDVSFAVAAGQKLAVTGRSGSGKSTLLHLAAGIDVPSAGTVSCLGRDVGAMTDQQRTVLRRNDIGLVFQFFYLLPHLTVLENVSLPGWIARDKDIEGRARELLERVGMSAQESQDAGKLSGGEMQRVAICRALVRKPRLLLADEPTGNLDDGNSEVVMDLLMRLVDDEGGALLYVTHSDEQARRADHRVRLQSGKIDPA